MGKKAKSKKEKEHRKPQSFKPRLIRDLGGGWRIEEWWVLIAPDSRTSSSNGDAPFVPVMFAPARKTICERWRDKDYIGKGLVRPVHMLVNKAVSGCGTPILDIWVDAEREVDPRRFEKVFPQATWKTY